jgi:PAS domain S-box-containing protein
VYRELHRQGGPDGASATTLSAGPQRWIQTDLAGTIIDLSEDAAALLRFSRNGLKGRSLLQFIGQDRHEVMSDMRQTHRAGVPVSSDRLVRGRGTKGDWWRVQIQPAREERELVWILMPDATGD